MTTHDEYRQYAKECLRWAAAAKTEDQRKAFLEMARAWTLAATQLPASRRMTNHRRSEEASP